MSRQTKQNTTQHKHNTEHYCHSNADISDVRGCEAEQVQSRRRDVMIQPRCDSDAVEVVEIVMDVIAVNNTVGGDMAVDMTSQTGSTIYSIHDHLPRNNVDEVMRDITITSSSRNL